VISTPWCADSDCAIPIQVIPGPRERQVCASCRGCLTGAVTTMVQGYDEGLKPEELAFQRLYGPWRPASRAQAKELFDEFGRPWWIAGGWAIEAFTGVSRHHEDIDVAPPGWSSPRAGAPLRISPGLRQHALPARPSSVCRRSYCDKEVKATCPCS
jgi:hypothetical protein